MVAHRLDHVGHRDDSGFQQNLLSGQALRVPRSVEALVMLSNGFRNRPWKWHLLYDLVAELGMFSDEGHLKRGEASRMGKDFGRNSDLAEVMDDGREPEPVDTLFRKSHPPGNAHTEIGDAPLMIRRIRVAVMYGPGQHLDGLFKASRRSFWYLSFTTISRSVRTP